MMPYSTQPPAMGSGEVDNRYGDRAETLVECADGVWRPEHEAEAWRARAETNLKLPERKR
jgi:hypothetical protein